MKNFVRILVFQRVVKGWVFAKGTFTGAFILILAAYGSLAISNLGFCGNEDIPLIPSPTPKPKGPHGGKWVQSSKGTAEVKVDTGNKKIHIYLPRNPEKNPTGINVVLFDEKNRSFSIDLKKLEQKPFEKDEMAHYQGELNPAQSSYMGIQISIPFSKDSPSVIEDRDLSP